VVIHWRDEMEFKGAQRSATFIGKVSARQGESWVLCHTMHVVFDRPVYFNQAQKKAAIPFAQSIAPPKPADPKADPRAVALADEKAKLDKVFCYPAPADSADDPRELAVYYNQIELDKAGKPVKSQFVTAQELRMFAQAQDASGEKFQRVEADGPGIVRIWQAGDKNMTEPAAKPAAPGQPMAPMRPSAPPPGAKPANPDEQEMKLTVVNFTGRMTAIDKGKVFQKVTFETNIKLVNMPAESPTVEVPENRLPPRGVMLTCSKELVVWSHKKGTGPAVQRMDASGNAYLRSDEYDGWGETISNDGKLIVINGSDAIPARIMNRFNRGSDQSGKKIIFDRGAGSYRVIESFGGTLGSPPK